MSAVIIIGNNTTVEAFSGGATGVAAKNTVYRVSIGGSWTVGDNTVLNVVTSANVTTCGAGWVTGTVPTMAITLYDRVQFVSDTRWFGSDNGNATGWDQQYPGAFYFQVSNQFSMPENLVSIAPYQGRVCLFSRRTAQIWVIDPNPLNISQIQVLPNIGTFSSQGAFALGDLDVIFPYDSGIRALRARQSSYNAITSDIGSAIDNLVRAAILPLTTTELAQCCSIVEPTVNRYWTFIPGHAGAIGTIFVLGYFPNNKIVGWSQYTPSYNVAGVQTQFTPQKFVVYNGQAYVCDANAVYVFGGTNNNTYDNVQATLQVPFYDEKRPGHDKNALNIHVDSAGAWNIKGSADWINNTWDTIESVSIADFDQGNVPFQERGSHFSFLFQTTDGSAATVTSVIFYYNLLGEQQN